MSSSAPKLSPLEVASGLVFGTEETAPDLPPARRPAEPLSALEDAVRPWLLRPPCLVSFSGGRDSSAVLALATDLARREGLELPIPATNRFRDVPSADESEWQEAIVRHLGLPEWVRLEHEDELDCVGPYARRALARHGLLWPFNSHFHLPLIEAARGGSLLTGLGGDEAFSPSRWDRLRRLASGDARPTLRDVLRVGMALSPRAVRTRVLARHVPTDVFRWLRPAAFAEVRRHLARESADEPLRWRERFQWLRKLRHMDAAIRSLTVLGEEDRVAVRHPLSDPAFLVALSGLPAARRYHSRTEAMSMFFGHLVPDAALARGTKASFDAAFWAGYSREFVAQWSGDGLDETLVDAGTLRAVWTRDEPDSRSFLLAQSIWLATKRSAGRPFQQQGARRPERAPGPRPAELPRRQGDEIEQAGRVSGGKS